MKKRLIALFCAILLALSTALVAVGCDNGCGGVKWDKNVLVVTAGDTKNYSKANWGKDDVSLNITNNLFKGKLKGVEGKDTLALNIKYGITTTLDTLIASDDLPEILLDCDDTTLQNLIDKNKVTKLNSYLENWEEDYPNLYKFFNDRIDAVNWDTGNTEPDAYGFTSDIYGFNYGINSKPASGDWYVQVQYRLLEYFDYPVIEDIDDLYDLVKQYIDEHPDDKDLVGIEIPLSGKYMGQNVGNTSLRLAGHQDDGYFYIDPASLEATYNLTTDYAHDFAKWLNKAYNEKVLDQECTSKIYEDVRSDAALGNVLVCIEPDWQLSEAETVLHNEDMDDRCYAKLPIYFAGTDATKSTVCNYDSFTGEWKAVLTNKCKNVEAVLQFLDFMWSEEGQVAAQWGVEGTHYTVDEHGVRTMKADLIEQHKTDSDFGLNTGVGLYGFATQGGGATEKSLSDNETEQQICPFSDPDLIYGEYKAIDKEVIGIYADKLNKPGAKLWKDLWAEGHEMPYGTPYKLTIESKTAIGAQSRSMYNLLDTQGKASEKVGAIIVGSTANFESAWTAWMDYAYDGAQIQSNAPTAGVGYREYQYEMAVRARLKKWHPAEYALWETVEDGDVVVPSAKGARTGTIDGNFNWLDVATCPLYA